MKPSTNLRDGLKTFRIFKQSLRNWLAYRFTFFTRFNREIIVPI